MGVLYSLARDVGASLESVYADDPIGLIRAKGALATHTGFLVSLIGPHDPDDPEKISKLRQAAHDLGITI